MEIQESLTSFVPRTAWPVSSFLARRPQSLCNSPSRLRVKFAQCEAGRMISFQDIRQCRAVRLLAKTSPSLGIHSRPVRRQYARSVYNKFSAALAEAAAKGSDPNGPSNYAVPQFVGFTAPPFGQVCPVGRAGPDEDRLRQNVRT